MDGHETNLSLDFGVSERTGVTSIRVGRRDLSTTPVFDAYWRFAAERQKIFFRRLRGDNGRLTTDPVLATFKFTNAYRASDRVSQYLIRRVIYRDDLPSDASNVFFRTLLFKLFNKIETWEFLEEAIGTLVWEEFDFEKLDVALTTRMAGGARIYSAAYIMPSAPFGYRLKHQNHLRLLESLMRDAFPERLAECTSMQQAYALLLGAPSIGPFLAYQFVTDLNYTPMLAFGEDEFVVAGPGALDGISKCFVDTTGVTPESIIRYMYENQARHFQESGIAFETLWGRPLQLIDCQNIFCEISKYARVAFPEVSGTAGRTRIKQKFAPAMRLPSPWYPPKWGINDAINEAA
ncbi:MAG: putative DNA base hypermodification protein [Terricaulis sp.]|nr:putative DNA base hypermodification protein [Terricaulis sp.]